MANPWFRMYSEFATDPKVQMLSEVMQRRYVMLLCLRCCNTDVTLHVTEIAFQLRITEEELQITKDLLMSKGMIDKDMLPTNWDKRQYVSDTSAARVKKHRDAKKALPDDKCNVTVTPPDTDADTDTEKKGTDILTKKEYNGFELPSFVNRDKWISFMAIRKELKAVQSVTAINTLITKLTKMGNDANTSLDNSIEGSWKTVYPLKTGGYNQQQTVTNQAEMMKKKESL